MRYFNPFRARFNPSTIQVPANIQASFQQFYNTEIIPIYDSKTKNPNYQQTEYANSFFHNLIAQDSNPHNQEFVRQLQNFVTDENSSLIQLGNIQTNFTNKYQDEERCHFSLLLTSTLLSLCPTQRVRGPNGYYMAFLANPKSVVPYHTDIIHPYKISKYMASIALKSDSSTPTSIIENSQIVEELQKHHPKIFEILSTVEFRLKNNPAMDPQPIDNIFFMISKNQNGKYFICLPDNERRFYIDESRLTKYSKDEVNEALGQFREILNSLPSKDILLSTTDSKLPQILVIKNKEVLHGRLSEVHKDSIRDYVFLPLEELPNDKSFKHPRELPANLIKCDSFLRALKDNYHQK